MKPEEVRELWYQALESGDYQQGMGRLQDEDNRFCCLGVLADVLIKNNLVEGWNWTWNEGKTVIYLKGSSVFMYSQLPPNDIACRAGLNMSDVNFLAEANDSCRFTFPYARKFIENAIKKDVR